MWFCCPVLNEDVSSFLRCLLRLAGLFALLRTLLCSYKREGFSLIRIPNSFIILLNFAAKRNKTRPRGPFQDRREQQQLGLCLETGRTLQFACMGLWVCWGLEVVLLFGFFSAVHRCWSEVVNMFQEQALQRNPVLLPGILFCSVLGRTFPNLLLILFL